jgi:hypothetical protein
MWQRSLSSRFPQKDKRGPVGQESVKTKTKKLPRIKAHGRLLGSLECRIRGGFALAVPELIVVFGRQVARNLSPIAG